MSGAMDAMDAMDLQRGFFELLMESQYWTAERMQEHQRSLLEPLLRHARANVPFYEHRLHPVFRPDGTIDWDRWNDLPVVTRNDLVEHESTMQARFVPAAAGRIGRSRSSGTTGVATRTAQTELSTRLADAALLRAYDWHELDYTRTMVGFAVESPGQAMWPEGNHRGPWAPRWKHVQGAGQLYEVNRAATPAQVLDFIDRHEARYIAGGTIRAQSLALEALRHPAHRNIDVVLTRGAAVTEECRTLLRDAFGARAIGLYSSKEAHKMAHPCPRHDVYHVNAELLLLEIVNLDTGRPVQPGETGKVLVTPFFNLAQPLIRYDIGDLATAGQPCECGRTLPVLNAIVGRLLHMFIMPDGSRMVPSFPNAETGRLHAAMWQMAQVGPNAVEIRRIPQPGGPVIDEVELTRIAGQHLWPGVDVRFTEVDHFDLPASGKLVQYAREWSP